MDKVMKIISWVLTLISMIGLAACFDAIMNHVLMTSFVGDDWFNKSIRILTAIGRVTFGWFICGKILFPIIYKYFKGDDTK